MRRRSVSHSLHLKKIMSNLLPQEGRKKIYKEYWMRVFSVWALLLAGALVTVSILFFPTYILLSARVASINTNEENEQASTSVSYRDVKKMINEANTYATQLDTQSTHFDIAEIIAQLDKESSPEILVTGVSLVVAEGEENTQLQVRGVAQKRDDLAKYVERLKGNPYFSEAKVPVADLAQAKDSHFTATIVVKKK